ncbi:unnamed protein product [Lactuca virosa]|uniref:Uncharacterized protein n=1 Tax=Lactuca virosa TaxID=75947 RepID=A0AAU9PUX5_9ASTR|nr:unnamed protein product [Lactuca virosa]
MAEFTSPSPNGILMEVGVVPDNWELQLKIYQSQSQLPQPTEPEIIEHAAPDSAVFPRAHSGSPKIKHHLCPHYEFAALFEFCSSNPATIRVQETF